MDERQDTVTREQVQEWAKLAGLSWFTEGDLEGLADFAIFARAALASVPAQQWISVNDRLPAEGQPVMFVVASKYPDYNGRVFGGSFCMLADVPSFNTPGVGYRASHWMPLPEAPASSVGSKEEPTS